MRRPLPLDELITKVGIDKIKVEPVATNITQIQRGGKAHRGLCHLTVLTSEFTPEDGLAVAEGRAPRKVGLLLWLPAEDVARVRAEYEVGNG